MKSAVIALAASGLWAIAGHATEPAALDEEFLEYLAEFESDAENWTWFAAPNDEGDEQDDEPDTAADDKQARPKAPPVKAQEKVDP